MPGGEFTDGHLGHVPVVDVDPSPLTAGQSSRSNGDRHLAAARFGGFWSNQLGASPHFFTSSQAQRPGVGLRQQGGDRVAVDAGDRSAPGKAQQVAADPAAQVH